jgi:periplasmic protein TonB
MLHLLAPALTALLLTPVASATDAVTHGASCTAPDQPAKIVRSVTPEMPTIAKAANLTGTTVVRVDLSSTGSVTATSVARSSGSVTLDRAALNVAKAQAYSPETQDCRAVAGSYGVEVEFAD